MPEFDDDFAAFAVAAAEEFCRIKGWKLSTVGLHAVGDAAFFVKLQKGNRGASLSRFNKGMKFLRDNWPLGAVWPAHPAKPFPRPAGVTNGENQRGQEQAQGRKRARAAAQAAKG